MDSIKQAWHDHDNNLFLAAKQYAILKESNQHNHLFFS